MKSKAIFKVVALLNFIVLISLFLVFRNGGFNDYFSKTRENNLTSPNGGTPAKINTDTLNIVPDSIQRMRLASSKSLVIIDKKDWEIDSLESVTFENGEAEMPKKRYMLGTKSAIVLDPKALKRDSIKESRRQKRKNKK